MGSLYLMTLISIFVFTSIIQLYSLYHMNAVNVVWLAFT